MSRLSIVINCGLGDNILTRLLLEGVKDKYTEIFVYQDHDILNIHRHDQPEYHNFLKNIGSMIFGQTPFSYHGFKFPEDSDKREFDLNDILKTHDAQPIVRPDLNHFAEGTPLDIGEYIVITTKVRMLEKGRFLPLLDELYPIINNSSYKVVLIGERIIETSLEYSGLLDKIYSIYDNLKSNISQDKLVDLTIPALGLTAPNFNQLKQDFLIMKNAKRSVIFGEGGNFWMSLAVGNTLAYRQGDDNDPLDISIRLLSHEDYHKESFVSKDWNKFMERSKLWIPSVV